MIDGSRSHLLAAFRLLNGVLSAHVHNLCTPTSLVLHPLLSLLSRFILLSPKLAYHFPYLHHSILMDQKFGVTVKSVEGLRNVVINSPALIVEFSPFGATLISCQVLNQKLNKWVEVACGYKASSEEWKADPHYTNVTTGRYGGRIANGRFTLDGKTYETEKNMRDMHTCHCGASAYNKKMWSFTVVNNASRVGVTYSYTSPHLENGMPGEVLSKASFYIPRSKPSTLVMEYFAEVTPNSPSPATCVNMFNHVYWNLNGVPDHGVDGQWKQPESVLNHWVKINSSRVAEADTFAIPTGRFLPVDGTVLDFRRGKAVKEGIHDPNLNRKPSGYDHPWAVDGYERGKLSPNATAYSPSSDIKLQVYSTYPCFWMYTTNNKSQHPTGLRGSRYGRYSAVGLEPQYFPDTPNRPEFPSATIRRGESTFHEKIVNVFSVGQYANL